MRINGGAAGVGNENWLRRGGNAFGSGAIAAVAEIYGDAERVHLLDDGDSRRRKTRVCRVEAAIAKGAGPVVCELHDPNAEICERG